MPLHDESGTIAPLGLTYITDVMSRTEEVRLVRWLEALPGRWEHPVLHGRPAERAMTCFGWHYRSADRGIAPAPPLPEILRDVRDRCVGLIGYTGPELEQSIVTRYPRGAGIGWHIDARAFGATVISVSLKSRCSMHFGLGQKRTHHELELAPRSLLILQGEARWQWVHRIPPVKQLCYLITFRNLATAVRH